MAKMPQHEEEMNKTYRFLNRTKLLELLAKSGLFRVPCQAAFTLSVSQGLLRRLVGGMVTKRGMVAVLSAHPMKSFDMAKRLVLFLSSGSQVVGRVVVELMGTRMAVVGVFWKKDKSKAAECQDCSWERLGGDAMRTQGRGELVKVW
jgi:hypothetical protein